MAARTSGASNTSQWWFLKSSTSCIVEAEVLPKAARKMLITHQRLCPMVISALRLESEMVRKRPNHESNVVGWEVGSVADNPNTPETCLRSDTRNMPDPFFFFFPWQLGLAEELSHPCNLSKSYPAACLMGILLGKGLYACMCRSRGASQAKQSGMLAGFPKVQRLTQVYRALGRNAARP